MVTKKPCSYVSSLEVKLSLKKLVLRTTNLDKSELFLSLITQFVPTLSDAFVKKRLLKQPTNKNVLIA